MLLCHIAALPPHTLQALHAAHITTVAQLLALSPDTLPTLTALPPAAITAALSQVYSLTATRRLPVITPPRPALATGTPLDPPLAGGLPAARITQLAGPPLSGKTALALATVATALSHRRTVVLLSSAASPTALLIRIRTLLLARGHATALIPALLHTLFIVPAPTPTHATAILTALCRDAVHHSPTPSAHVLPHLLVYDSPAALSALLGLRAPRWTGHVLLTELAAALRCLAVHAGTAILLTNRVVRADRVPALGPGPASISTRMRPALGNAWAALVDVSIVLCRSADIVSATVVAKNAPLRLVKFNIAEGASFRPSDEDA